VPGPDVLWAVGLTTCGAIIAWCFQQIIASRDDGRRLRDHIEECNRRQVFIMDQLTRIGEKLSIETPARPR